MDAPSVMFVSYQTPSAAEFGFRAVDPRTRSVWSPSAGAFVPPAAPAPAGTPAGSPAPAPTDTLIPLVRVGGPGLGNVRVGAAAGLPDPPPGVQWFVWFYDLSAPDSDPVSGPEFAFPDPRSKPVSVAVTVRA